MAVADRYIVENGRVSFKKKVKVKPPFVAKPDPTIDHIMSNVGDCEQQESVETAGMVTLRIPSDPLAPNGLRPLDINLNGQNYSLPRDVSAKVPREVADIVLNAQSSTSIVPSTRGGKIVCQVDPDTGDYLEGKGPVEQENRRFNVIVEERDE